MKTTMIRLSSMFVFILTLAVFTVSCDSSDCPTPKAAKTKKAGFSGEDLNATVKIVRDKATKTAVITIAEEGAWEVYAGTAENRINMKKPILTGSVSGTYTVDVGDTCRVYFQVETQSGRAIMAERVLPMAGAHNFRDLGGYKTTDGRYVKWGKILRSENMGSLTEKDLEYLKHLPLVSVADFRGPTEVPADKVPASVQNQYSLPMTQFGGVGQYGGLYNVLVTAEIHLEKYRELFSYLMDEDKIPLLFHCSAGKDRTGVTAALILIALGVEEETIFQDFLMTNTCYAGTPSAGWTVDRSWLQDTFNTLASAYESTDSFFTETLGVDLEAFRDLYLY